MPAALDRVISEARSLEADASAAYASLVADLAADTEVPAGDVLACCEAAGRTLDQLAADVSRLSARRRNADLAARLGEAEAARRAAERELAVTTRGADASLEAAVAELDRQRAAAFARRDAVVASAQATVDQSAAAVRECEAARGRLAETADPALRERLAELRTARGFVAGRLGDLRARIDGEDARIAQARASVPVENPKAIRDPRTAAAERAEATERAGRVVAAAEDRRRALLAEAERLADELNRLDAEVAAAEAELLVP